MPPAAAPPAVGEIASQLHTAVFALVRRLRQHPSPSGPASGLTNPEAAALARLDRCGPTSASELARLEQISPQSMGATLATLAGKGCISRAADPSDGRRLLVTLTAQGRASLRRRRDERTARLAQALADELTPDERADLLRLVPLLERVAQRA